MTKIHIKIDTKPQLNAFRLFRDGFKIFQKIDGDLVDAIRIPGKEYFYWIGAKHD